KNMHQKKTGALLSCAVQLGVLISDCRAQDALILDNFAKNIGLAYQIQDDVLDVLTPEEILGKRQNSDANKGKPTYPTLLGLEASQVEYERLYQCASDDLNGLSVDAGRLQALIQQLKNRMF
ncbi:MAG: geranyl transferase, partial [Gammaproteobacteria bacterium]|nr:geranyl transferase [Gammaproteobacteria bacterium]